MELEIINETDQATFALRVKIHIRRLHNLNTRQTRHQLMHYRPCCCGRHFKLKRRNCMVAVTRIT